MDFKAICKVMRSLTYKGPKGFGWQVQAVWFGDEKGFDIRVYIAVNDRLGGDLDKLYTHYTYGPEEVSMMNPEAIVRRVKAMLIYLESHEVEEQLLYKGRRVFDPHRPKLIGPNVKREKRIYAEKIANTKTEIIKQLKERANADNQKNNGGEDQSVVRQQPNL